jgi:hypothetical protein
VDKQEPRESVRLRIEGDTCFIRQQAPFFAAVAGDQANLHHLVLRYFC